MVNLLTQVGIARVVPQLIEPRLWQQQPRMRRNVTEHQKPEARACAPLQSIFESRVYGVSFDADGNSIYAAVLGQRGSLVYQIDLKSNHMMTVLTTEASAGMQGLAYDSTGQTRSCAVWSAMESGNSLSDSLWR